ncbi:hypothetical protein PVL29_019700 [Vitis rotundifolia]|uniref:Retrovirus-related Pol polyprotein from transposon TNT 1-94-like beta-barrel domain-containing protein n=1 Tax=Vitis rotundifolia TaxID=103349 RepID=A0AA38Z1A4_VITRO|nr:hypothetical protein PVL29_019700 [Vitis rotundifolia]
MQYFLKMQSEKVWNTVEFGWSLPKVLDREGRPTNVIKPKLEWDRSENEVSENNARAMYSIFNAISTDEFRRIATCTSAKEAWDILQVTHEGTNAVKVSKVQMLTSRFETIRMDDHETFGEFNTKLMDIVNSSFNLGEPISKSKVVRKILRSLLERFRAKVTAIEESKDVDSLKIDELVGSLQTFEMTLVLPRKAKGIALKAIKEESLSSESEDDEKMSKGELTKFAKKFKKYMKFRKAKKESNDGKKWRNSIEKRKIWRKVEECTNFIAFAASVNEEPFLKEASSELSESSNSNDDDMSFDTAYETLYKECLSLKQEQVKWKASKKILTNEVDVLKGEKKAFLDKIAFLENEHLEVNEKCDVLKSENQMFKDELSLRKEELHPSSKRLNELINLGCKFFDKRGLGFLGGNATPSSSKTVFVKPCEKEFPKKTQSQIKFHCNHCGKMEHTFDRCYARLFDNFQRKLTNLMNECHALKNRFLNENKRVSKKSSKISHNGELKGSTLNEKTKISNVKQIWVKKNELKCFVVHTALRASESHSWYLDSGCSHHMTGNKSLFTSFIEFDRGNVTFGDGNVARVKGKGTICAPNIPNLEEVLYVEGLKANLISISQMCENEFNVQFSQNLCKVFDLNDVCVMIGLRTCDNCYVVSQKSPSSFSLVCESSKIACVNHLLQHRLLQNEKEHPIVKVRIDRGRKFDDANVVDRLNNHVLHSRSKHVDIKHHFIQDLVEDKIVSLEFFPIKGQIANNVTKPLDVSRFESLRSPIGLYTLC